MEEIKTQNSKYEGQINGLLNYILDIYNNSFEIKSIKKNQLFIEGKLNKIKNTLNEHLLLDKFEDILEKKDRVTRSKKRNSKKKSSYSSRRNKSNKKLQESSLLNDSLDDFYCRLERAEELNNNNNNKLKHK
jgi:hypothetical protein